MDRALRSTNVLVLVLLLLLAPAPAPAAGGDGGAAAVVDVRQCAGQHKTISFSFQ